MRISIVGGGNIGTLMAAEFSFKGHTVTVYTSSPEQWNENITVTDNGGNVLFDSKIECITNDILVAADADYIFVTLPSIAQGAFVEKFLGFIKAGTRIGVVPGYGGAEYIFKPLIDKGAILFGFQRVHAISRLERYGQVVCMKGRKDSLFLGAINIELSNDLCRDMELLFDMPCIALPNFLCVTLTPSNPILHTSRLYSMFKEITPETRFDKNILFYEEWTDLSSELLLAADEELQNICRAMPKADLKSVRSLKDHYESYTKEQMTKKIRSIKAFNGINSPMKELCDGWVPDFDSRYFTCDFSYGLDILCQFGDILSIETPVMNEMMSWYKKLSSNIEAAVSIKNCGIDSIESIYEFYNII